MSEVFRLQASAVLAACPELANAGRIVVGYSGGLDSSVLLHLVATLHTQGLLKQPVLALHINHGLQAAAATWEQQCLAVCRNLDLPFVCKRVRVDLAGGASPEEAARTARYAAFAEILQAGDVLLLAQHEDDQVETVLFRLLRGSGAAGMAGIPRVRACGSGQLCRPLLAFSRKTLAEYASRHALTWSEDASNQEQRYARNFLRTRIIPALTARWPGLAGSVTLSARLSGEAALLQDELAAMDLAQAVCPYPNRLLVAPLLALSELRRRNALRYWLQGLHRKLGYASVTWQVLHRISPELLLAAPDAEPLLGWGRGAAATQLRRYRGVLYALPVLPAPPAVLQWDGRQPLMLPAPLGSLQLLPCSGPGLPRASLKDLEVRFRHGGEKVKEASRPTRTLQKIFQERGVPPWLRDRIPLLFAAGALVAVGDLCIVEGWLQNSGENHCRLLWQRSDLDCGY
jgi:tRNA(Ile)-lysidine synthase